MSACVGEQSDFTYPTKSAIYGAVQIQSIVVIHDGKRIRREPSGIEPFITILLRAAGPAGGEEALPSRAAGRYQGVEVVRFEQKNQGWSSRKNLTAHVRRLWHTAPAGDCVVVMTSS